MDHVSRQVQVVGSRHLAAVDRQVLKLAPTPVALIAWHFLILRRLYLTSAPPANEKGQGFYMIVHSQFRG